MLEQAQEWHTYGVLIMVFTYGVLELPGASQGTPRLLQAHFKKCCLKILLCSPIFTDWQLVPSSFGGDLSGIL